MFKQVEDLLIYTGDYEENFQFSIVYQPVYGSLFFIQSTFSAFKKPTLMSKKIQYIKKLLPYEKKLKYIGTSKRKKKRRERKTWKAFF